MPCNVQEDAEQRPVAVRVLGEEVGVAAIDDRWEDEEFWWRDNPVVRVIYQVTLENGRGITLFKNMLRVGSRMALPLCRVLPWSSLMSDVFPDRSPTQGAPRR